MFQFYRAGLALGVGCIFILAQGCKKQEAPPPPAPERTSTSISDLVGQKTDAPPPPAAAPAPDATQNQQPEETKKDSNGLPDSATIYNGIQRYMAEHQGRAAKGIDELVAGRYIPALPAPPPGKKYELNKRFATLTVVDK